MENAVVSGAELFNAEWAKSVFPPERTDEFFEALFGDAEEGAYNIELAYAGSEGNKLEFLFNLKQRGNACLACNLTYGLPKVFERHPIINVKGVAQAVAERAGKELLEWKLGSTREQSNALHMVPLFVWLE
ncbi:pancreas/duodenum homeobox protein 1 [Desulfovibrio sp. OttesenSCG-928-C14]|nr:pancreas/duodenum homeobox protein 1 [Desulfovibrio sp. OttesenSCG-928-C14]